jgi:hypothetical protein
MYSRKEQQLPTYCVFNQNDQMKISDLCGRIIMRLMHKALGNFFLRETAVFFYFIFLDRNCMSPEKFKTGNEETERLLQEYF